MSSTPGGRSAESLVHLAFRLREFGVVAALAVIILVFSLTALNFFTFRNVQNVAINVAITLVVGIGEMMVILTRNIDLSVGAILGLSGYISLDLMLHHGLPQELVPLIAVAIGLVCGLANGLLVARIRIPAIIVTLATMSIFRGIVISYSRGYQLEGFKLGQSYLPIAQRIILDLPFLSWLSIAVAILGAIILRSSHWGRDLYALGSNPEAARLAGIPVTARLITAFAASGALAGLGGFMFVARWAGIAPTDGTGFEFVVISAAVIGGVNLFGGQGTVLAVVLGALVIGTLESGFTLLKMSEFLKIAFQGIAIIAAVTLDSFLTHRIGEMLRVRRRRQMLAVRHAQED